MRKLVTIRTIQEIKPIENADVIEHVRVDGWWVVCKKNEFKPGDEVLYLEIDSWVPYEVAPFLSKGREPRDYNGIKGELLRTIELRGALSQGLILNPNDLPQFSQVNLEHDIDYASMLGVVKWEPPLRPSLQGIAKGDFPSFISKTDQKRVQNIVHVLNNRDEMYEISLKLDGSSTTIYCKDGEIGVCNRSLELELDNEDNEYNTYVKTALASAFIPALKYEWGHNKRSLAFQCELMGPGIQANKEKFIDYKLFCFDIFDIDQHRYLRSAERIAIINSYNLPHVPIIDFMASFKSLEIETLDELLSYVSQTQPLGWSHPIEGLVFKHINQPHSFKVINNEFLFKY
jgi:RNA ligase (TIGR02306 family)